jgi:cell division transport system permease protein
LLGSLGRIVNQPFATLMTMGVVAVALALPLFLNLFLERARRHRQLERSLRFVGLYG